MQTIFPILRYNDARGAIQWLCATFGFVELFSVPEAGQFVRHAQLKLGTNVIMLGSPLEDGLPYQTLISSLLHKYVSGRLREA